MSAILQVENLETAYGASQVLFGVSFSIEEGEMATLLGRNGMGKTTTIRSIMGLTASRGGAISFRGERIDTLGSRQIAHRGVGRTFQHVNLISAMSVLENTAIGAHLRGTRGTVSARFRTDRAEESRLIREAANQIERCGLSAQIHEAAGSLSLGQQRIVEIARALASDPVLLLLDEPAAGLRYNEKKALGALLRKLRDEGMTLLLVEHDMDFVMGLVDRLVVMDFGEKLAEGSPTEIQNNPKVLEAYLGSVA